MSEESTTPSKAKAKKSSKGPSAAPATADDDDELERKLKKKSKKKSKAAATSSTASDDEVSSSRASSSSAAATVSDSAVASATAAIAPPVTVAATSMSSTSSAVKSVKKRVNKLLGFGGLLGRGDKHHVERADPSIDMGVVNAMLDELGDRSRPAAAAVAPQPQAWRPATVAAPVATTSPYLNAKAKLRSMQDTEDAEHGGSAVDAPPPLSPPLSPPTARFQLLRQRSQVVNAQYEGAKRQLQRLASDHTSSEEPPLPSSPARALSPVSKPASGARTIVKSSSQTVGESSPTRLRRQSRQNIMAPTRVAPVPSMLQQSQQQQQQQHQATVPPTVVLPDPSRAARDATVAAYMACCEQKGLLRDHLDNFIKATAAHLRGVSDEFAQDAGLSTKVMRQVEGKLEASDGALRELRDTVQKLEFRIQVVKRAQRSTNVALKLGQLLPPLGVVLACVSALSWLVGLV